MYIETDFKLEMKCQGEWQGVAGDTLWKVIQECGHIYEIMETDLRIKRIEFEHNMWELRLQRVQRGF